MPLALGRQPGALSHFRESGVRCENIEPGVTSEALHQQIRTSGGCGSFRPGCAAGAELVATPAHGTERLVVGSSAERKAHMVFPDDAGRSGEGQVASEKDRLTVVHAERGAALDPVEKLESQVGWGELDVAGDGGDEGFRKKVEV